MKIIGITGQSGSGKGYLSGEFEKLGYVHADADKIYHRLLSESNELKSELTKAFGNDIEKDGKIDRKALGKKVFGKENARRLAKLNKITHKYVCREYIKLIRAMKEQNGKGLIIDAPLLIEARLDKICDVNIFVTASRDIRIARIMERDSIDESFAKKRIDSQKDGRFYADRCDHIFINNGESDAFAFAKEIDFITEDGN